MNSILRTKTRCLEENEEKHGRKENPERKKKKENKGEALRASLNYAEELGPLLFLGRRSETGAGYFKKMLHFGKIPKTIGQNLAKII